jgi:hypothetical protein
VDPDKIMGYGVFLVSMASAIIAGIVLTIAQEKRTPENIARVWIWAVAIFAVQFLYSYLLILFGMGSIA